MDKDLVKELFKYIDFEGSHMAQEIIHPEKGFLSYLLRCKNVNEKEKGKDTILIKDMSSRKYRFEPLDNDIEKRIEKRKSLYKYYASIASRWICLNYKIDDLEGFRNALKEKTGKTTLDTQDFLIFTKILTKSAKKYFPSFEEDMIVWHTRQIRDEEVKAPHLYILLRRSPNRYVTRNQESRIVKNPYKN